MNTMPVDSFSDTKLPEPSNLYDSNLYGNPLADEGHQLKSPLVHDKPIFQSTKNNSDTFFDKMRQDNRALRARRMNMLHHNQARQRASLAMRYGMMPRTHVDGSLTAADFYDDGLLNNSAPHIHSQYQRFRQSPLYNTDPMVYGIPNGIIK